MLDKTTTRSDLSEAVYRKIGLSHGESTALVKDIFDHLAAALAKGEDVKISAFGRFRVHKKNARVGRNPKTGQEVTISPRRVPVFRPSNKLKKRVDDVLSGGVKNVL